MITEVFELRNSIKSGSETVSFTVKLGTHYCFICRRSESGSEERSEHIVPISLMAEFEQYMSYDVKKSAFKYAYAQMKDRLRGWLPRLTKPSCDESDYIKTVYELAQTNDEEVAFLAVRRILSNFGGRDFLFAMRSKVDPNGKTSAMKYLVGCRGDWIQLGIPFHRDRSFRQRDR